MENFIFCAVLVSLVGVAFSPPVTFLLNRLKSVIIKQPYYKSNLTIKAIKK